MSFNVTSWDTLLINIFSVKPFPWLAANGSASAIPFRCHFVYLQVQVRLHLDPN